MRLVVQRVSSASVTVDNTVRGEIQTGLLVLVGFATADTQAQLPWAADKIAHLRIFEDDQGKMNRSVLDVAGSVLLVPNFTLAGNAQQGRRPSFDGAMRPEQADPMFNQLAALVKERGVPVQTGVFRAHMHVTLTNDGPITLVIDAP
ncbi:MAG: D-aminoacyl-tRNA deacylase [Phycisphaerales bacterium]